MNAFANIAITRSGMLIEILAPVFDQNKKPTGYMCEQKGHRSFVELADINYCDRSNLICAEDGHFPNAVTIADDGLLFNGRPISEIISINESPLTGRN